MVFLPTAGETRTIHMRSSRVVKRLMYSYLDSVEEVELFAVFVLSNSGRFLVEHLPFLLVIADTCRWMAELTAQMLSIQRLTPPQPHYHIIYIQLCFIFLQWVVSFSSSSGISQTYQPEPLASSPKGKTLFRSFHTQQA